MPSKDKFHAKKPELNETLERPESLEVSDRARRRKTGQRAMSALVQRLAKRLDVDPDTLAKKISEDTLRRTKFPMRERVTTDGKRIFEDDPQIIEGPKSLIHK
jgi:hypothetical protein